MKRLPAFFLLEAALSLIIMGIVATLTLPLLTSSQKYHYHQITEKHQQELMHVLAGYAMKYQGIPAPSLPSLQGNSILYEEATQQTVVKGIIPYKELGISESLAKDGYGNWFTYIVAKTIIRHKRENSSLDAHLAQQATGERYCNKPKPTEKIIVRSLKGTSVLNEEHMENDYMAFILISHGSHATGAFHPNLNEQLPVPEENTYEKLNTINTKVFYTRIFEDEEPHFRHKVFWVTRNNLVAIYGKCPCPPLEEVFYRNPSNLPDVNQNTQEGTSSVLF